MLIRFVVLGACISFYAPPAHSADVAPTAETLPENSNTAVDTPPKSTSEENPEPKSAAGEDTEDQTPQTQGSSPAHRNTESPETTGDVTEDPEQQNPENQDPSVPALSPITSAPIELSEPALHTSSIIETGPQPSRRWAIAGHYALNLTRLSDMRVDSFGNTYGQQQRLAHRLGTGLNVSLFSNVSVVADIQWMAGLLSYDPLNTNFINKNFPNANAAAGADFKDGQALRVRQAYVSWITSIGLVRVGRMTSEWGLGMLSNSGDPLTGSDALPDVATKRDAASEQPAWPKTWASTDTSMGSDNQYGDIVDRLLYVTQPFSFFTDLPWAKRWQFAFAADSVVRDDTTERSAGDVVLQGTAVLRHVVDTNNSTGAYVVRRTMKDRRNDTLDAWAFDVFANRSISILNNTLDIYGALEAVYVGGNTTVARNNAFTGELTIQSLGYLAQAGGRYNPLDVSLDLELGYASGDSNPNDRFVRSFSFNSNYQPSLILFRELRRAETYAAAVNAADPSRVGYAPDALQRLPSNGSVQNAIYISPTFTWSTKSIRARVSALWAVAEEDVVDPFYSTAYSGGTAVNFQGGNGRARGLGMELNAGVDYAWDFRAVFGVDLTTSIEGGYFLPGNGFKNAAGVKPDPVALVFARVTGRWQM